MYLSPFFFICLKQPTPTNSNYMQSVHYRSSLAVRDASEHGGARARHHWAIARAFGNMCASANFRYAHTQVCKQLCAPGGKWEERDRAAFEADFGTQQQ